MLLEQILNKCQRDIALKRKRKEQQRQAAYRGIGLFEQAAFVNGQLHQILLVLLLEEIDKIEAHRLQVWGTIQAQSRKSIRWKKTTKCILRNKSVERIEKRGILKEEPIELFDESVIDIGREFVLVDGGHDDLVALVVVGRYHFQDAIQHLQQVEFDFAGVQMILKREN